jgi:SulP family sulfate permease
MQTQTNNDNDVENIDENIENDNCIIYCKESFKDLLTEISECFEEINYECIPKNPKKIIKRTLDQLFSWIHIPYFPPIHHPGWLTTMIVGPYNSKYIEVLISDVIAGATVSLTCIPQAMSYATIASLSPVNGLYASITPSLAYTLFGSSMQLQVGPVAVVSLLTAALLSKYNVDYINDPQTAIDAGCQAALSSGILLAAMGILNMGNFINFMAHPVMSGFTSAAACLIGLSQLKDAFGFIVPETNKIPSLGVDVEYNYEIMEWYAHNWKNKWTVADATDSNGVVNEDIVGKSYQNHYSIALCFTIYGILMCNFIFKQRLVVTKERKQKIWYILWKTINPLFPFVSIVIAASVVFNLKNDNNNFYSNNLKIVGKIKPGIDFIRLPKLPFPIGQMLIDVIPITLVAFMESYSVSRRIASQRNQLFLLNASQEMFANGAANLVASISSGYPVS